MHLDRKSPPYDGVYPQGFASPTSIHLRRKQATLPSVAVPSFSAFRAQTNAVSTPSNVRRKPLPPKASPVASRYRSADWRLPAREQETGLPPFHRAAAPVDSPTRQMPNLTSSPGHQNTSPFFALRDLDKFPHGDTPVVPNTRSSSVDSRTADVPTASEIQRAAAQKAQGLFVPVRPHLNRQGTSWHTAPDGISDEEGESGEEEDRSTGAPAMASNAPKPPHLRLDLDGVEKEVESNGQTIKRPKSPVQRLTSLFGWKSSSHQQANSSPTTPFSDRSLSPVPSPRSPHMLTNGTSFSDDNGYTVPPIGTSYRSSIPDVSTYTMELERELREVCAELASSIRREVELEDEVDRWKTEAATGAHEGGSRRTSDYFSDSGLSSVRYPLHDVDSRLEELERLRRKAEQERASLRVEMGHRIQEDLRRRTQLEARIHSLETTQRQTSSRERSSVGSDADRIKALEFSLEDTRRRYHEERHLKENYEDLLSALQQEVEEHRLERDNLRDEVVPQLRSRLGVFEGEATKSQSMLYEHTRLQKELQVLKDEHGALLVAKELPISRPDSPQLSPSGTNRSDIPELAAENQRLQHDFQAAGAEKRDLMLDLRKPDSMTEPTVMQNMLNENTRLQQEVESLKGTNERFRHAKRPSPLDLHQQMSPGFECIAEDDDQPDDGLLSPKVGLTRSNSLARSSAVRGRSMTSFGRSNSVREGSSAGSHEHIPDRFKDVENQRDALHQALKSLLKRHYNQVTEHAKTIKVLQRERDMALNGTPRRTAFNTEVHHLRSEVNHLRRRADEALVQKWQCEKGLSGLKMDLDRAQQETSSLRILLRDQNILPPLNQDSSESAGDPSTNGPQPPISLETVYIELQTTYALSLARLVDMEETVNGLRPTSAEAQRTRELLRQSVSTAKLERENAQREAEEYRQQALGLRRSGLDHLDDEQSLAAQLYASAKRMDELTGSVQRQIESDRALRARLAEAIDRGDSEQKKSAARIVDLQRKLKVLEDRATTAQQHSEEAITEHEEELQRVKLSDNSKLSRVRDMALPRVVTKTSAPHVGTPSSVFALRSPRLDNTSSGLGISMVEASRTAALEKRVEELESALRDADVEMQEVVSRMNRAQIDVAELQTEQDEAMKRTRRLYADILAERSKMKDLVS